MRRDEPPLWQHAILFTLQVTAAFLLMLDVMCALACAQGVLEWKW
jgi:hypothetical protein